MEAGKLRKEMESLWKETFGDSSEYVSLIFNAYYDPENTAYYEEEGRLMSALLSVPYEFISSGGTKLKGLYLCGLATRKDARRKGIMSTLLEEMNRKAEEAGYDFTFLIPAGGGLKRYYRDHGYFDSFYKIKERYVKGHNFGGDPDCDVRPFAIEDTERAVDFLLKFQEELPVKNPLSFAIIHDEKDWRTVLEESVITGENAYLAFKEEEISGIAFTCHKEEGEKRETLEIKKIMAINAEVEKKLLGHIGEVYSESSLVVIRDLDNMVANGGSRLWSPFFAQNNGPKAEYEDIAEVEQPFNISRLAYPFGMIRIFNLQALLAKGGFDNSASLKGFSKQELLRLVLRRPVGNQSDALENILDLPELSLTMSLLLE